MCQNFTSDMVPVVYNVVVVLYKHLIDNSGTVHIHVFSRERG